MTDPYGEHIAIEGGPGADPIPATDMTPERAEAGPDLVLDAQRTYTRTIQDTAWATTVQWIAGAAVSTTTLLTYLRISGYPETVAVDADRTSGVVTITTTHATSEVSTAVWAAWDGTTGQTIVSTMVLWSAVAASTTFAVPRLQQLISLWVYLEQAGVTPISIYRKYDTVYTLQVRTYGAIPAGLIAAYTFRAVSEDEVTRFSPSGQINEGDISDTAGLNIALKDGGGIAFEVVDYRGDEDVSDEVIVTAPTGDVPVQVRETTAPPIIIAPAYYSYVDGYTDANPPPNPKEGDVWQKQDGSLLRWIQGVWTAISPGSLSNEGSSALGLMATASGVASAAFGFFARATQTLALAVGGRARADGVRSIAVGSSARALADDSIAFGTDSLVEATSPRSMAEGVGAFVYGNNPDVKISKFNVVKQQRSFGSGGTTYVLLAPNGGEVSISVTNEGQIKLNEAFPRVQLPAGGAAAGTAPLKLTSGAFLTTPEPGVFEFAGGYLYFTALDGVRRAFSFSDHTHTAASLGRLPKRMAANQSIVPPAAVGTIMAIPDLILPIAPGETWAFEFSLSTYCNGSGGLRVGMSYPGDANVSADVIGSGSNTNVTDTVNEDAAVYILAKSFNAYAGAGWIKIFGSVVCGATASNVSLRWQRMTAGDSAYLDAGSILRAERVN